MLPEACPNQQVMVHLVSAIRVMPIDTLVHTVHQVVKTPPPIHGIKQDFSLEVSVLELLYVYMQSNTSQSLNESWASLLSLLKDGLSLTAPAQFLLLAILNEYVQKCPPMQEKKDIKDLQDVSAKVIILFYNALQLIIYSRLKCSIKISADRIMFANSWGMSRTNNMVKKKLSCSRRRLRSSRRLFGR